MGSKTFRFPTGVGICSLLVIFAVLCLSVFGMMSLSEAQTQKNLGDKAQQYIQAYYGADCQAQEILAKLRLGEIPQGVDGENGDYSYCCEISETQVLWVQVTVKDEGYQIRRWQVVSAAQWQPEEKLPVWNGEE